MAENQPPPAADLDDQLDAALEASFPASDPPSMLQPHDPEDAADDPVRP